MRDYRPEDIYKLETPQCRGEWPWQGDDNYLSIGHLRLVPFEDYGGCKAVICPNNDDDYYVVVHKMVQKNGPYKYLAYFLDKKRAYCLSILVNKLGCKNRDHSIGLALRSNLHTCFSNFTREHVL